MTGSERLVSWLVWTLYYSPSQFIIIVSTIRCFIFHHTIISTAQRVLSCSRVMARRQNCGWPKSWIDSVVQYEWTAHLWCYLIKWVTNPPCSSSKQFCSIERLCITHLPWVPFTRFTRFEWLIKLLHCVLVKLDADCHECTYFGLLSPLYKIQWKGGVSFIFGNDARSWVCYTKHMCTRTLRLGIPLLIFLFQIACLQGHTT